MERDTLFLLAPDFADAKLGAQSFYCVHCAAIEGILHYYPDLARTLAVVRVAFPRPRPAIVALLGEAQQSCPVLVVARPHSAGRHLLKQSEATGAYFVSGVESIAAYLSAAYGIAEIHP
ncbi:DUF3088 family protein [Permianibacter sp. IMCC34836]|nr:DUF3088 family protein [Permianibacter fluminis]